MQCPFCKEIDKDRVIDSRPSDAGQSVRRRRHCEACGRRFTTRERVEETVRLSVIKRDGTRVAYDRQKMFTGLQRACWKRPVPMDALNKIVDEVEEQVFRDFDREVPSKYLGDELARRLLAVDKVAYLRFVSVNESFQALQDFVDKARETADRAQRDAPGQQDLFHE